MATRGAAATASYGINFDSNAKQVGEEGATALEQLRKQVESSTEAIKGHNDVLKRLKGSSDEVKRVREELKAKVDAERLAISKATLELQKAGTTYEKLTAQHKKFDEETKKNSAERLRKQTDALKGALNAVGGPANDVTSKISGLTDVVAGADGAMGALAIGSVAAVAAFLALGAGIVFATVKLATWVLETGNALRTLNLTRIAMTGSEADAKALGNQIEVLGKKVPTTREQLNDMGNDLTRAGLGGQTLVDTLNAAAQASAGLDAAAGNKVADFIKRGKLTGRFSLGQFETQGLGVQFGDVSAALAKNTKSSVQEAAQALIEGRVTLGDGAKALRDTFEKRFAGVNLAKMLDLDVIKTKIRETLGSLTKDIDLKPVLEAFSELAHMLDSSTETGADLKLLLEGFGKAFVDGVTAAKPLVKGFLEGLILASLDLYDAWLTLQLQFKDTFGDTSLLDNVDLLSTGVTAAKIAVFGFVGVLALLGATTLLAMAPMLILAASIYGVYRAIKAVWDVAKGASDALVDFGKSAGEALGKGDGKGVASAAVTYGQKLKSLLPGFAGGLKEVPSDDFAARLHKGERVLTADEAAHYNALVEGASGMSSSSSAANDNAGGGGVHIENLTIPITIQGGDGVDAEGLASVVRRELVKALEIVLRSRGLVPATQGGATS
jgi:hypothetical protein